MPSKKRSLLAASGAGGDSLYVEDVFSTYLYTGADANETVTNGIDLDGEGGFVWIKPRTTTGSHLLYDTERGIGTYLQSQTTAAVSSAVPLGSFNSDGFTTFAYAPAAYVSWSFRKAEKFFDVVTYTGTGVANNVAHSIGAVPGFIVCKATSTTSNWGAVHSSIDTYGISLNTTNAGVNKYAASGSTSTTFNPNEISDHLGASMNLNGVTYVAYLFASDAGGFGDDGSESVIKCGSFTPDGSNNADVSLGWEPQWILWKKTNASGEWNMYDTQRGMSYSPPAILRANESSAEFTSGTSYLAPTATGFAWRGIGSGDIIYIAIRRPMKTPESGTEVYAVGERSSDSLVSNFPVDLVLGKNTGVADWFVLDRLRGTSPSSSVKLETNNTDAEAAVGAGVGIDSNTTIYNLNGWSAGIYNMFKRAAGFMDVVAYTGNGTAGTTYAHNLSVAPEMMIVKVRSIAEPWVVYHTGLNGGVTPQNYHIRLTNGVEAADSDIWNNTAPTSSAFTTGGNDKVNANTQTYIAYLFATLAGVSKVGSYTGTGADLNVDCGFTAGARFILIKRSDSTGDWYVWDSVRGIIAGNDPYLLLNSTAAEVTNTDYIDPLSSGFTVTSTAPAALNASGGTYIFLAIA